MKPEAPKCGDTVNTPAGPAEFIQYERGAIGRFALVLFSGTPYARAFAPDEVTLKTRRAERGNP